MHGEREGVGMEELAFRTNDGVDVSLLWSRREDRLSVVVTDQKTGDSFEVPARRDKALDVFYHPFAYAGDELACLVAA
jgi:hypothetical protein